MTINGIPLHPLVVHAAVVLTPLAAVLAVVFAVVPRWRWAVRWPYVVTAVAGAAAVWLASATGDDLKHRLGLGSSPHLRALVDTHEAWAGRLQAATWVLAGVAVVGLLVVPHVSPLRDGATSEGRVAVLRVPVIVLSVLVALVVLFTVYQTGDAGARAVWAGAK